MLEKPLGVNVLRRPSFWNLVAEDAMRLVTCHHWLVESSPRVASRQGLVHLCELDTFELLASGVCATDHPCVRIPATQRPVAGVAFALDAFTPGVLSVRCRRGAVVALTPVTARQTTTEKPVERAFGSNSHALGRS